MTTTATNTADPAAERDPGFYDCLSSLLNLTHTHGLSAIVAGLRTVVTAKSEAVRAKYGDGMTADDAVDAYQEVFEALDEVRTWLGHADRHERNLAADHANAESA